jgi:hypothetical protein
MIRDRSKDADSEDLLVIPNSDPPQVFTGKAIFTQDNETGNTSFSHFEQDTN